MCPAQAAAARKKRELIDAEIAAEVEAMKAEAKGNQAKGGKEKVTQSIAEASRSDRQTTAKRAALAGTNREVLRRASA